MDCLTLGRQSALEGIDQHRGIGAVIADGFANNRRNSNQLPSFPSVLVQVLGILVGLEFYFSLTGVLVGVVDVDGLVLPLLDGCSGRKGIVGSLVVRLGVRAIKGK